MPLHNILMTQVDKGHGLKSSYLITVRGRLKVCGMQVLMHPILSRHAENAPAARLLRSTAQLPVGAAANVGCLLRQPQAWPTAPCHNRVTMTADRATAY